MIKSDEINFLGNGKAEFRGIISSKLKDEKYKEIKIYFRKIYNKRTNQTTIKARFYYGNSWGDNKSYGNSWGDNKSKHYITHISLVRFWKSDAFKACKDVINALKGANLIMMPMESRKRKT